MLSKIYFYNPHLVIWDLVFRVHVKCTELYDREYISPSYIAMNISVSALYKV